MQESGLAAWHCRIVLGPSFVMQLGVVKRPQIVGADDMANGFYIGRAALGIADQLTR